MTGCAQGHPSLALRQLPYFSELWGDAAAERQATCPRLASRAVQLDPADSRCQRILAIILLIARNFGRAEHHAERSVALNPDDADAAVYRACVLSFVRRPEEALAEVRRALALNPFPPSRHWNALLRVLQAAGRHAEAAAAFERIERPSFHHDVRVAICHAAIGRSEAARRAIEQTLAATPDSSSAAWTATLLFRDEADRERLRVELVAAGQPP